MGGPLSCSTHIGKIVPWVDAVLFTFDMSRPFKSLRAVKAWWSQCRAVSRSFRAYLVGTSVDRFFELPLDIQLAASRYVCSPNVSHAARSELTT